MKKKTVVIISIISLILFSLFMMYLWDGFFSNIFPWTKTNFSNYQEYIELLDEHHFYASYRFVDEIPKDALGVEYYVHRRFREKYAAHSIVLSKAQYVEIVKNRVKPYRDSCDGRAEWLEYVLDEDEKCDIEELKKMNIDVDFLENVIQTSNEQNDFYCLVVNGINTTHGTCYTGVIVNDTTHEVIEFSVELPDEEKG